MNIRAEESEPGTLIDEVVAQENIDLVMMPTHGHGPMRRMLLGSITGKVLHDVQATVFTGVGSTLAGHQPSVPVSLHCLVRGGRRRGDGKPDPICGGVCRILSGATGFGARDGIAASTSWEVDITPYREEMIEASRARLRPTWRAA